MMNDYVILLVCSVIFWQIAVGDYVQLQEFFKQQSSNETFARLFQEHLKQFQDDSQGQKLKAAVPFPCQKLPAPLSKPTSVHKLTPMDVKVVAGMGDSITAGMGIAANNILADLIEYRGLSWSIGGNEDIETVDTLANILKVYNPDVTGYSTGTGPYWWEPTAHLNVADSGAKAEDMPGQAELLVKRMKSNSNIDFHNDWKVITFFVGGNDLCDFCEDKEKYGAESYKTHVQAALDYLHQNVPRAFVNLVEVLPISVAKDLNQNLLCDVIHFFGCRCAAYPENSEAEAELNAETQKYRDVLVELVNTERYDTREDFTVIIQPFFSTTTLPKKADGKIDLSYFAPDCFHLSLKGHAAAADALWNNMVEPVGKKRIDWLVGEKLECPTNEQPYFYTNKNSNKSFISKLPSPHKQDDENKSQLGAVYEDNQSGTHQEKSDEKQTVTHAAIMGASIGAVCIVLVVGIFVLRKRRARKHYENLHG